MIADRGASMNNTSATAQSRASEVEFLHIIQGALVSTYRDVLREPLPPEIRRLLARLHVGDSILHTAQTTYPKAAETATG
jgi:hypothetical protein